MEDLENRVGVSHSPLIGEHRRERGGRKVGASYFLIKSVYQNGKFFYSLRNASKLPTRDFLSIRFSPFLPFVQGFVRCELSLFSFLRAGYK